MADLRLLIEILTKGNADLRRLNGDLKRTNEQAEKTNAGLGNIGKTIGAFATGFVALKTLDFLGDATNAAAEFNDTISASSVILGEESTPALEKWADGAAEAFGASKQQALDAANTFAVFGKSADLTGDELVNFSTDLTELAGDLASFRGGTTQEAIDAIGSALRGEQEPIRKYGVLLDEATLRQRALAEGIVDTTKRALTPQQRVLAAQAEIFAQTTDAQGDFARTSDEMANTQRKLAAELENVVIEIGQKLIPVMLELANFTSDVLVPALSSIADGVDVIADGIASFREGADKLTGPLGDATKGMDDLAGAARKVPERLDGVGSGADSLRTNLRELADDAPILIDPMVEAMLGGKEAVEEIAGEIPGAIGDAMLEKQFDLGDKIAELVAFMEASIAPGQEMMNLQGFLMSAELAEGLGSNDPAIRQKSFEMQQAAVSRIQELGKAAFNYGYNFGAEYASGIANSIGLVHDAGRQLGGALASQVRIESEPPDPNSPLHGITKWGYNIATTLAEGMRRGVGVVTAGSAGLAAAITPGTLQAVSAGGGGMWGGGGGYETHIHLTYAGEPPEEPRDLVALLLQVAPFVDGRLRVTD